ncbi:heparan-alpha-glucosaminide N-acetyltransferase domain-containing protein [Quadrisphaera sp. DSM 44207]|uniref:heparan-alpha-glucosaminide N-acetyltransferase domain-containing protein n=1 Tax=Quadrisphaera sp. DSM 44207 TaxID=1881057 RepID=UPI00088A4A8A|nr:heparan-alpha-glucosaminide N-acetyltransferase domain-containing protein [Quadrisphaera sp. DSM 44207]SDQ77232.1 Protein of unknown function [Quadrisphaera sp. DSM 44207]
MSGSTTRAGTAAPTGRRDRLSGVDAARGLALLGMMAVHVLPETDAAGRVTAAHLLFSGRASALFAVLAGVGLALASGGPHPRTGAALAAARRGVLARAGVVTAVGLTLALWPSPIAIILVVYGVLFAVAVPFLGLRARTLGMLAVAWPLLSPVLGHLLRRLAPPGPGDVPSWLSLLDPVQLLTELVLTGYYPALQWTGYVLVGLAVGRLDLHRAGAAARAAVGGAVLAVAAVLASRVLLDAAGGVRALAASLPPDSPLAGEPLQVALRSSLYGTTPTTSWAWLTVAAPHSGTPFDLLSTSGTALAVLGLCLLVSRSAAGARALLPVSAPGSMTLTLYTTHVLLIAPMQLLLPDTALYLVHALGAVAIGLLWRLTGERGPLEQVAAAAARAAAGPAARPR